MKAFIIRVMEKVTGMQERFVLHNVKQVSGEFLDVVIEAGKIVELKVPGRDKENRSLTTQALMFQAVGLICMFMLSLPLIPMVMRSMRSVSSKVSPRLLTLEAAALTVSPN